MRKLEGLLGCRLLFRDTRNDALTAQGERLLGPARAMVVQADTLLARFSAKALTGEVRFGSPEDFASAYLPEVLGTFAAAHRSIELHVSCQLTLPLIAEFEAGHHDLIVINQYTNTPGNGAKMLWRERLVWVAGPGWVNDLTCTVPLVLSAAPCVYRNRAVSALCAAGRPCSSAFTSPSFAGVVATFRAGLGVTVMPQAMMPPGFVTLDNLPNLAETELALLTTPRPGAAVSALVEFVTTRVYRKSGQALKG